MATEGERGETAAPVLRASMPAASAQASQRWRTVTAAAAVVAVDQATKAIVLSHLAVGQSAPLIGPLVSFTLVRNTGAAFGLLGGSSAELAVVAVIVSGVLWWLSGRTQRSGTAWSLGLLLGGALGNLVDRIARHGVVDFINFHVWPVFNTADTAITVGALWLLWQIVRMPEGEERL